jgi:hypothetical protein
MEDLIENEGMAVDICYAYISNIYGKEIADSERPFRTKETKESWIIKGSLPVDFCGGVFEFEISKIDGKVLKLIHTR